jgi:hypothetical protein
VRSIAVYSTYETALSGFAADRSDKTRGGNAGKTKIARFNQTFLPGRYRSADSMGSSFAARRNNLYTTHLLACACAAVLPFRSTVSVFNVQTSACRGKTRQISGNQDTGTSHALVYILILLHECRLEHGRFANKNHLTRQAYGIRTP